MPVGVAVCCGPGDPSRGSRRKLSKAVGGNIASERSGSFSVWAMETWEPDCVASSVCHRARHHTNADRSDHGDCQRISPTLRRPAVVHRPHHGDPAGLVTMAPTTPIPSTPFPLQTTRTPMITNYGCSNRGPDSRAGAGVGEAFAGGCIDT